MNIAVFGTGTVGQTFASRLSGLGHTIRMGTRNPTETRNKTGKDGSRPMTDWLNANPTIQLTTFAEAAANAELIINATMGGASVQALQAASPSLKGKIVIDVANPLDFSQGMPPSLIPALSNTWSLGEELQRQFPDARIVKTLNTMWCGLMVNPGLVAGGDHTVFVCGNDAAAKAEVVNLLGTFGWKSGSILDLGDISASRGTEAVLPVWLRIWMATQNGAFNLKVVS